MKDPWEIGAEQIASDTKAAIEQANRDAATRRRQATAQQQVSERQWAQLQQLIDEVTPQLEAFLASRGAAAKKLLAQYHVELERRAGKKEEFHPFILFGVDRDGSHYHSVFFDKNGIGQSGGVASTYGGSHSPRQEATARKAVEYFIRFGEGQEHPRSIVTWLEAQINQYMPEPRE